MTYDELIYEIAVVCQARDEALNTLCLSKGGWEGWLQCQLYLDMRIPQQDWWWNPDGVSREKMRREVAYPSGGERCDLVIGNLVQGEWWIEIKAYGSGRTASDIAKGN